MTFILYYYWLLPVKSYLNLEVQLRFYLHRNNTTHRSPNLSPVHTYTTPQSTSVCILATSYVIPTNQSRGSMWRMRDRSPPRVVGIA